MPQIWNQNLRAHLPLQLPPPALGLIPLRQFFLPPFLHTPFPMLYLPFPPRVDCPEKNEGEVVLTYTQPPIFTGRKLRPPDIDRSPC